MAADLLTSLKYRAFDANGDPLAGGKLYSYKAGTSTPKDTYADPDKNAANTNPVILDANGEADIYFDGSYKFVLKDANDVVLATKDDIQSLSALVTAQVNAEGALAVENNLSDLDNADTALTNLGLTATATELNYMDGVTSAVQTQLDGKVDDTDIIDEDDMSSDSATKVPTQQSVKAYVDAHTSDTTTAHAASAISNTPSGNLSADNVQDAVDELQGDIDSLDSRVTVVEGTASNNESALLSHVANSSNPHSVTAAQVGNTTAQWNADKIQGADIAAPTEDEDGKAIIYDHASGDFTYGNAGGAGSGGINLESSPYAQDGDNSWATFDDGATATGVDLTGGTATATFAADDDNTSILDGDFQGAYKLSFTAADHQGEGVSKSYSIPKAFRDKGYFLVSARYSATAALATGDMIFRAYDVTNSELIASTGLTDYKLPGIAANGTGRFTVIVPIQSDTASVRLGFMRAVTTATAFDFCFSDFRVGPPQALVLPPTVTEWADFTPAGTISNGSATVAKMKRSGDTAHVSVKIDASGAFASQLISALLPSNISVSKTKLVGSQTGEKGRIAVGTWHLADAGVNSYTGVLEYREDTGSLTMRGLNSTATPATVGNGDTVTFRFEVPITEWDTGSNIKDVAELELSASIASVRDDNPTGTISTTFGGSGTVVFDTVIADEHGLYSNGEFTAKSDKAKIRGQLAVTGTEALDNVVTVAPFVNGTQVTGVAATTKVEGASSKATYVPFDFTLHGLDIGDKVTLKVISDMTSPVFSNAAGENYCTFENVIPLTAIAAIAGFKDPTVQRFTSGSGTYTTPEGVKYLKVTVVGGGGGGSGSGTTNGGASTAGNPSTFKTSGDTTLISAGGGGATQGIPGTGAGGGTGGAASVTSPAIALITAAGGAGAGGGGGGTGLAPGGTGGANPMGGAGKGAGSGSNAAGSAGAANTGAGGGGGGIANDPAFSGNGGGAGGFARAIIDSPDATYLYAVGAGGAGGAAGTSGNAGGAGASGIIIVEEYY